MGIFTLLCFLINSAVLSAAVEPGAVAALPNVQSPVYGVKTLVSRGITLFPEYKPAQKSQDNNDINPPLMASSFSGLSKPVKRSNKVLSGGQLSSQQVRFVALEDDVGKSQAPPGTNCLLMFILVYIISLHRSNLPSVIALSRTYTPNYAVR